MRFGQAAQIDRIDESESDESAGASDATVGTLTHADVGEVAAAEEDVATVGRAIATAAENVAEELPKEGAAAEEDAAESKEGAASAKAENVAEPKEEDVVAQSVAALLGRDERLAPPIPTSWRRPRRDSGGKGGGSKMEEARRKLQLEDSDEAAERRCRKAAPI